jgi:hypothetical protein
VELFPVSDFHPNSIWSTSNILAIVLSQRLEIMSWYSLTINTPDRSSTSFPNSDAPTEMRLLPGTTGEDTPHMFDPAVRSSRVPRFQEYHVPSSDGTTIPPKREQYRSQIFLAFASFLLSVFAFYYAYEALINPQPLLGKLIFSPSTTVFVINVLSQSVAFLIARVFASAFEALRWSLAARRRGVTLPTFLSLSSGTSLYGIFMLLLANGQHRIWCAQRFAITASSVTLGYYIRCSILS